MAKFHRKRFYRSGSRDKFSVETKAGSVSEATVAANGLYQGVVNIIPATSVEGMRKVKHITCTLTSHTDASWCAWAVVYVPEGYNPNTMTFAGGSLYEPSQFVMACGLSDFSAGPIRIHSPLSRNLNSGDAVWLVVGNGDSPQTLGYCVRYAISLQ